MTNYESMTKNELMELCIERNLKCENIKFKKYLIEILRDDERKKYEELQKEKMRKEELAREYWRKLEKKREANLAAGLEVDPTPLIRVDIHNYYNVDGYVLTRLNGMFKIDYISHCSCFGTEYDEDEENFISYEQLINDEEVYKILEEDERHFLSEEENIKGIKILRKLIMKNKKKLLTWKPEHEDELLDYIDLTEN